MPMPGDIMAPLTKERKPIKPGDQYTFMVGSLQLSGNVKPGDIINYAGGEYLVITITPTAIVTQYKGLDGATGPTGDVKGLT